MRCLMGPSFRWATLLFDSLPVKCASFWYRVLISWGSCATCDSLLYPSVVLRITGLEIIKYRFENQIDNDNTLLRVSRSVLCAAELDSWFLTASAVRCYTVIQSYFDCCGSLLSCHANRYACCWVCAMEDRIKFESRHSPLLIFAILLTCWSNVSIVFGLLSNSTALLTSYAMELRPIDWTGSNAFCLVYTLLSNSAALFLLFHFFAAIDCEHISRLIGLINIMLVDI